MKLLALESSALAASAAVTEDEKVLSEVFCNVGLTHSVTLLDLCDKALALAGASVADIDAIAVAAGPGSFTGVRIGIAAVKGLADGAGKPVMGVSTLEAMAYSVPFAAARICPVMDARRSQVYNALFGCENGILVRLTPDRAISIEELAADISDGETVLIGDGADKVYAELSGRIPGLYLAPPGVRFQHASSVAAAALAARRAGAEWQTSAGLVPAYLRLSQAERERKEKEGGDN